MLKSTVLALALCLPITGVALADLTEPHPANGVWCDTKEQATQFLTEWNGSNSKDAMATVNTAAGKENACILSQAIIIELETMEEVTTDTGTWILIRVAVLAIPTPGGWTQIPPLQQFTSRKVEDSKKSSSI